MRSRKELAEFQFDASAPPVNLGVKFDDFCNYQIDEDLVESVDESLPSYSVFSNENVDIPIQPESLILIANDLDPEIRDREEFKNLNLPEEDETSIVPDSSDESEIIFQPVSVESIDFKIKHRDIMDQLTEFKSVNKITEAIRLVDLAIHKMSIPQRNLYGLEEPEDWIHTYHSKGLIDKSVDSVNFVNQVGRQVNNLLLDKFPDRFKNYPKTRDQQSQWLTDNIKLKDRKFLDLIFTASWIASEIKFSNIEINDNPGFNQGIRNDFKDLSCHQVLFFMNMHTILPNSVRFKNIEKLVNLFPQYHGGKKLFYLEYLISRIKKKELFFEAMTDRFFESDERWKNDHFAFYHQILGLGFRNLTEILAFYRENRKY